MSYLMTQGIPALPVHRLIPQGQPNLVTAEFVDGRIFSVSVDGVVTLVPAGSNSVNELAWKLAGGLQYNPGYPMKSWFFTYKDHDGE